jgi:NAD+ synthase
LKLDAARVVDEIAASIEEIVLRRLNKRGAVIGLSGGIDSSVVAALCAYALGRARVLALLMPERESSGESTELGHLVADHLGIATHLEDVTAILEGAGCYQRRDEAIRKLIPEYGAGWRSKITLPGIGEEDRLQIFTVVAQSPEGVRVEARMTSAAYLELIAAMNFKQRARKMVEYYHADRLHYAVAGTPNRLEFDQGFFVKLGDGAADLKPIAHLYKVQVYQLAEYLGIPEPVRQRTPTTDTYSLPQTQEEFYFALPYEMMDLCLFGRNHGASPAAVAAALGLEAEQVERVYRDIDAKRRAARYLHLPPQLVAAGEVIPAG